MDLTNTHSHVFLVYSGCSLGPNVLKGAATDDKDMAAQALDRETYQGNKLTSPPLARQTRESSLSCFC